MEPCARRVNNGNGDSLRGVCARACVSGEGRGISESAKWESDRVNARVGEALRFVWCAQQASGPTCSTNADLSTFSARPHNAE